MPSTLRFAWQRTMLSIRSRDRDLPLVEVRPHNASLHHRIASDKLAFFFKALCQLNAPNAPVSPSHFPKKRWVKVAMKLISMTRPTIASIEARTATGSPRFLTG